MSATAEQVREIGFPWFDRHAVRGGKEIFAWSHAQSGEPIPLTITGCEWRDTAALLAYYAGPGRMEEACDGFIGAQGFATWEEAEAWLFAPSGGGA